MNVKYKNQSFTTLAAAIDADYTEFDVVDSDKLPDIAVGEYFYATLRDVDGNEEIIKVTAKIANALTVERAAEGTVSLAFPAGSLVENRFTAQTLRDVTEIDYLLL